MGFKSMEAESSLMPKGEYEAIVKDCCFSATKNGTECVKFEFVVRSDIDQPCQKKRKFKQFYRDPETGRWPAEKIGQYAHALGVPQGEDFELEDMIGRCCVMVIGHYLDGQTGAAKDFIYFLKPSRAEAGPSALSGSSELAALPPLPEDGGLPF